MSQYDEIRTVVIRKLGSHEKRTRQIGDTAGVYVGNAYMIDGAEWVIVKIVK